MKYVSGQVIDKVTLKHRVRENGKTYWVCTCECGNDIRKESGQLTLKNVRCIDCGNKASGKKRRSKHHNEMYSSEYRTWTNMKNRCSNENYSLFHRYGGRGIKVCDRWNDSFDNFLEDMGKKPSDKHSLDRIDNDKGYSKDNCRWATEIEQANNRSTNRMFTIDGKTKTLSDWCRSFNVQYGTIQARVDKYGLSIEKALKQGTKNLQPRYTYSVGSKTFNTVQKVSDEFGISRNAARNRFESDGYPDWTKVMI